MYYSKSAVLSHNKYLLAKVAESLAAVGGTNYSEKDIVGMLTSVPGEYRPDILLDTTAGTMRFGILPPNLRPRQNSLGWVYCQFTDVEAAKRILPTHNTGGRLNPYSGKWNYMFSTDDRWQVNAFVHSLEMVQARNPRPR